MTILWAEKDYGDLDAIADDLAGLSDEAAERTIDRIQKASLLLREFPNLGAKVDETGVRKLIVSDCPYVVLLSSPRRLCEHPGCLSRDPTPLSGIASGNLRRCRGAGVADLQL
jgi:plasmid stabilization system protein ParE